MYKQISENEFNKLLINCWTPMNKEAPIKKRNQVLLTMIGLLNIKARLSMRLMSLNTQSGQHNTNRGSQEI